MYKKILNWYQILQILVPIDRYLNNNGIHKAYKILKSFYKGSKILVFNKNLKAGYWSVPLAWEVIEAKYDRREKYIKRLEKKYPDEITEEEANSLAPDPDRGFEELDRMIHELIIG